MFRPEADQADQPVEQRPDLLPAEVSQDARVSQIEGVEQRNERRSRHADGPLERPRREALHPVVGAGLNKEQVVRPAFAALPELGEGECSPGDVFQRKQIGILAFPPATRRVFVLPGEDRLKRPLRRRNVEHGVGEVMPGIPPRIFPEKTAPLDAAENLNHARIPDMNSRIPDVFHAGTDCFRRFMHYTLQGTFHKIKEKRHECRHFAEPLGKRTAFRIFRAGRPDRFR
ncbi:hypothetical protein SDC9_170608 [bioreactor metagenome]|uniref:Uncharacterized protein n=1 Tax=bioreactor metagenome TaxID=1076179 RepID=A0A645GB06_9ZZZZ